MFERFLDTVGEYEGLIWWLLAFLFGGTVAVLLLGVLIGETT